MVGGVKARQEGERCSECLDTHKDRYHLSNEALVLNGPGGHRKRERKVFGEENTFPHHHLKKSESWSQLSDHDQAHTTFEGGTHENHTERNEMSYGIQKRENLDLVQRWWF